MDLAKKWNEHLRRESRRPKPDAVCPQCGLEFQNLQGAAETPPATFERHILDAHAPSLHEKAEAEKKHWIQSLWDSAQSPGERSVDPFNFYFLFRSQRTADSHDPGKGASPPSPVRTPACGPQRRLLLVRASGGRPLGHPIGGSRPARGLPAAQAPSHKSKRIRTAGPGAPPQASSGKDRGREAHPLRSVPEPGPSLRQPETTTLATSTEARSRRPRGGCGVPMTTVPLLVRVPTTGPMSQTTSGSVPRRALFPDPIGSRNRLQTLNPGRRLRLTTRRPRSSSSLKPGPSPRSSSSQRSRGSTQALLWLKASALKSTAPRARKATRPPS